MPLVGGTMVAIAVMVTVDTDMGAMVRVDMVTADTDTAATNMAAATGTAAAMDKAAATGMAVTATVGINMVAATAVMEMVATITTQGFPFGGR